MPEYNARETRDCYNRTARQYAENFLHELDNKPLDRSLLDRFNDALPEASLIYDFGCGSGQTTQYIHAKKRHKIIGLDFSEQAIQLAMQNFNEIEFMVDDILNSKMAAGSADGILAFYAIVHFTYREVEQALREWLRLLKPGGFCLFCFHAGDEALEVTDFLGVSGANATWFFLDTDRVLATAEHIGFRVEEAVVRYPYVGVEHESKRAYVWLKKPEQH